MSDPLPPRVTKAQRRYLRTLSHRLDPIVSVGHQGVTEAVCAELEVALKAHELVKVKLRGGDRERRAADIDTLCSGSGAQLIQRIGNVASLYRPDPENPRIQLPED